MYPFSFVPWSAKCISTANQHLLIQVTNYYHSTV
jgi:hypothetical protein